MTAFRFALAFSGRCFALALLLAVTVACRTPAGAPEVVRAFSPASDTPSAASGVTSAEGGWRVDATAAGSVRLFEVAGETCDQCRLVYRAQVKTADLASPAYLEMWVRSPGQGEFFSKGLDQPLRGSTGWASYEISFFLKKGERADLVKLNVAFEGPGGSLLIKDVELLQAPLQ